MANNKYTYEIKVEGLNGVKTLDDLLKATSNTIGGLEQRKRVLEDLVKNVDRSSKEFKDFSRELNQTNLELKKFDSQIEGVGLVEFAENATKVAGAITGAFALGTIAVDTFGESLGISKEELEKAEASFQKLLLAVQSFQALSEGFRSFNTLLPSITKGVTSIGTAFSNLNNITKASIFGLGIAAIALVVTYWEDITNYISNSNAELKEYNENEAKRLDNTKQRVDLTLKSYERIQEAELKLSQNQLNRNENIDEEIALLKDKFNITKNTFNEEIKKAKELKKDLEIEKSLKNEISKIDEFIKDATEQRNFLLRNGVLTKESEASLNKQIEEAEKRRLGFVADLNKASDLELEKNRILLSIQNQIDEKEGKKLEKIKAEKELRESIFNILKNQTKLLDDINDSIEDETLNRLNLQLEELNLDKDTTKEKINNLFSIRDTQIKIAEQNKKIALDNNKEEKFNAIENAKTIRDEILNNENSTLKERTEANLLYQNTLVSIEKLFNDKRKNINSKYNNEIKDLTIDFNNQLKELLTPVEIKVEVKTQTLEDVEAEEIKKGEAINEIANKAAIQRLKKAEEIELKEEELSQKRVKAFQDAASVITSANDAIGQVFTFQLLNLQNLLDIIDSKITNTTSQIDVVKLQLEELDAQREELLQSYNDALLDNNLTALNEIKDANDELNKTYSTQRKELISLEKTKSQLEKDRIKRQEEIAKKERQFQLISIANQSAVAIANIAAQSSSKDFTFGAATVASIIAVLGTLTASIASAKALGSFAEGGFTDKNKLGSRDETGYRVAGIVHEGEYVVPKKVLDSGLFDNEINRLEAARKGSFVQGGFTSNNVTVINNNDEVISLLSVIASKDNVVKITDINDTQNKLNSIEVSARS